MPRHEKMFVVFEGGGAKGIAHLGVLLALEAWRQPSGRYRSFPPVEIAGYGGSSIGALIALLACLGFKSSQLYSLKTGESDVLRELNIDSPTQLFGYRFHFVPGWWLVGALSWAMQLRHAITLVTMAFVVQSILAYINAPHWMLAAIFIFFFSPLLILRFALSGLCQTETIESAINNLLANYAVSHGACAIQSEAIRLSGMTFSELSALQLKQFISAPLLKIVATDVDNKRLQLFSATETPDVSIAKAIAASMAMPIVFQPVKIEIFEKGTNQRRSGRFFDGGLTSNLPVWAFNPDRELDPDVKTLAVEIREPPFKEQSGWILAPFALAFNTIYTTIFGARELEKGQSRRVIELHVEPRIEVLKFDIRASRAKKEIMRAAAAICFQIKTKYFWPTIKFEKVCAEFERHFDELVVNHCNSAGIDIGSSIGRFRISIAREARGLQDAVKIIYCYGYAGAGNYAGDTDGTVDDRLLVPVESHVGMPFKTRKWHLTRSRGDAIDLLRKAPPGIGPKHRYEEHLVWRDLRWAFSVPIFAADGAAVQLTVTIDTSMDATHLPFLNVSDSELSKLASLMEQRARQLLDEELAGL